MKLRGLFITGTDTGVGKTVLAACLMRGYGKGGDLLYWKPVQTGTGVDDDTAMVRKLSGLPGSCFLEDGARLERPLSPDQAAPLEGRRLRISALLGPLKSLLRDRFLVVEGAGGLLVPLNGRELMAGLAARLGLPLLIAARSGLGTINHTLLTLEAARDRGLSVAGVVLIGALNPDNRRSIERHGRVRVLAEIPHIKPFGPAALRSFADRAFRPHGISIALRKSSLPGER